MEALVAIGLAGNVVQFVQFAGKLISEAESIRTSGSPASLPDLKNLTENLTKQVESIKKCLTNTATALLQEEQYLLDISSQCHVAGLELITYIDKFLGRPSSCNILQSAKKSVKLVFSPNKIADFAFKLDRLRSTLILSSILAFKASANLSTQDILTHLQRIEHEAQEQGIERARLVASTQLLVDIQGATVPKLDAIQEQVQDCLKQLQSLRDQYSTIRETEILQWLDFRQRIWRYEEIPLAHQETCEWVFSGPSDAHAHSWDSFTGYLSQPEVAKPYFINGHPGSGKSTLMKFIATHPKTEEALQIWAKNVEVMIVKFFFSNLGTDLQKTTLGMLRNLMHDILARYPELIPAVFSGMYQSWADVGPREGSQPTAIELKLAFERLISSTSKFVKICIFIDGVDELVGDHKEIAEFLCELVSPHIKMVVSSRPINACTHTFQGSPTLRLHELTAPDIAHYINDTLVCHRSMIGLNNQYPIETSELVSEIKNKASGVFLWVRLVVRLLIDGVEAGDDLPDLQRKLRSLPGDLRKLYSRMMSSMKPEYQSQAAEIFQLLQTWKEFVPDQPLRTIVLSFAMQSPLKAFSQPIGPLDPEVYEWLCHNAESRINSRCCGLLDGYSSTVTHVHGIQSSPAAKKTSRTIGSKVDYFHRTIFEFVSSQEVWGEICEWRTDRRFDAALNLASGLLASIKTTPNYPDALMVDDIDALTAFYGATRTFSDTHLLVSHMDALDEVMTTIRDQSSPSEKTHWSMDLYPSTLAHEARLFILKSKANMSYFACRNGLFEYVIAVQGPRIDDPTWMMLPALENWMDPQLRQTVPLSTRLNIMSFITNSHPNFVIAFHLHTFEQVIRSLAKTGVKTEQEAEQDDSLAEKLFGIKARSSSLSQKPSVQYSIDCAALVAMCLAGLHGPALLVSKLCPNAEREDGTPLELEPDLDLESMASMLQKQRDPGISQLGRFMYSTLRSLQVDKLAIPTSGKRKRQSLVDVKDEDHWELISTPSMPDPTLSVAPSSNRNLIFPFDCQFEDSNNDHSLTTEGELDIIRHLSPRRAPPSLQVPSEAHLLSSKRRRRGSNSSPRSRSGYNHFQSKENDDLASILWSDDVEMRDMHSLRNEEGCANAR